MPKRGLRFGDLILCSFFAKATSRHGRFVPGAWDVRYFYEKTIWTFMVVGCVRSGGNDATATSAMSA